MKIEMAKNSGFCMGVRNAVIKIVEELNTSDEEIYVYGPLIHNPQTIEVLKNRGLITINSLDDIKGKSVAIRTHGIPVDESRYIKNEALRTINLTCSRVARVQSYIKKFSSQGYFTVIVGDKDHAEVIGLKSYASSGVFVVSELEDVANLPEAEKYLVVSQTTHERNHFEQVVKLIEKKNKDVHVIDTICDSTRLRQDDVHNAIARGIDTLVVVGGRNSANTTRLVKIGIDNGIKTFHVETDEELNPEDFANSKYVLVTAGASTPGWIINNVLERLYIINNTNSNFFVKLLNRYMEFFVRSNIISSIAAFLMVCIARSYGGLKFDYRHGLIASLFIFVMYTVNNYLDREFLIKSNSYKYKVYEKYGKSLLFFAIIGFFYSIYLSYSISPFMTGLFLFPYILGILYSTPQCKFFVKGLGIDFIKRLYNTKAVTGFGWLIVLVFIPYFGYKVSMLTYLSISALFFAILFMRQFIIDLVAFQGDLILGRDTLPTSLGIKRAIKMTLAIAIAGALIFSAITIYHGNWLYLLLNSSVLYYYFLLRKIKETAYLVSIRYEILIDLNFALMFLCYLATGLHF